MVSKKLLLSILFIGFVSLIICDYSTAKAIKIDFSGVELFVLSIIPPQMMEVPSGNLKVKEFKTLYYENTDNDRINGYGIVTGIGNVNIHTGEVQYSGTFTIREKLDDLEISDITNPPLDPSDPILENIEMGKVLWEGTWRKVGSGEDSYIKAVLQSPGGSKLFYALNTSTGETKGYILDMLKEHPVSIHACAEFNLLTGTGQEWGIVKQGGKFTNESQMISENQVIGVASFANGDQIGWIADITFGSELIPGEEVLFDVIVTFLSGSGRFELISGGFETSYIAEISLDGISRYCYEGVGTMTY